MRKEILGNICTIVSGGTPSRSNREYWDGGDIPWIKISDVNGKYVFEDYIGLDAYDGDTFLGIVNDIVDCGLNNYVFDIVGSKEILIPLNDKFMDKVILNDRIVFKEVEGLVDAN